MRYIKGFDTLRAVSIIMVIVAHLLPYGYEFYKTRLWIVVSGDTGVQVFFTLSGFLITALLLNELKGKGRINFKNFFARRALRLFPPLIILFIVIGYYMFEGSIDESWVGLVFSIFYAYNFVHHEYHTTELSHTWSLAVEEQFYLIWPFVISVLNKISRLSYVMFSFIVFCVVGYYWFPELEVNEHYHTQRWFLPAAAPIIIGSYFALLNHLSPDKWQSIMNKNYWIIVLGVFLFVYPLYSFEILLKLSPIIQSIGVSFALLWLCYNQESRITKVVDNRLFRYLGQISYGIYVYQGFFLRTGPGGVLSVQQYPLNIILVVLIAILSYEFYEKPILKLKKRFV